MGKILNLPQPTDENGNLLSAEDIDIIGTEPVYVPIELEINGRKVTFTAACDFDQVDSKADQHYQLYKNEVYKVHAERKPRKAVNSKLTNQKETTEEPESDEITPDQARKLTELKPKERQTMIDLLFPADFAENPVFLGGNVPGMPEDLAQAKAWLARGGKTQIAVLEACIMAYDPTGPLAQGKKSAALQAKLAAEMEATVLQKLEDLKNLDVTAFSESSNSSEEPVTDLPSGNQTEAAPTSQSPETTETTSSSEPSRPVGDTATSEGTGNPELPDGP